MICRSGIVLIGLNNEVFNHEKTSEILESYAGFDPDGQLPTSAANGRAYLGTRRCAY
jgi:hypothetical protein